MYKSHKFFIKQTYGWALVIALIASIWLPVSSASAVLVDEPVEGLPPPQIQARVFQNRVRGDYWQPGAWVTLVADDPETDILDFVGSKEAKELPDLPGAGRVNFLMDGYLTLHAGVTLSMTDGNIIKTHTVTDLGVDLFPALNDAMEGHATPGSGVQINLFEYDAFQTLRYVYVDEQGIWGADFSIDDEWGNPAYDISLYTEALVYEFDADMDVTLQYAVASDYRPAFESRILAWINEGITPDPVISIGIRGTNWILGSQVNLTIDDPSTTEIVDWEETSITEFQGSSRQRTQVKFYPDPNLIKPGNLLTMTDGIITRVHTIADVWVSGLDTDADFVWGRGPASSLLEVSVELSDGSMIYRQINTNELGLWTADFAQAGPLEGEVPVDIEPGVYITALYRDGDRDATAAGHNLVMWIEEMFGPSAPTPLGTAVEISADLMTIDGGIGHFVAVLDWGDGTTTTFRPEEVNTGDLPPIQHIYSQPGVYSVHLALYEMNVQVDAHTFEFVVVYDPENSFVTGAGWFVSPEGAYLADPSATGKAHFGFVSRYKKGATIPDGNAFFEFKTASFSFNSLSYEWLVVNKNNLRAQFKGTGLVNGLKAPNGAVYKFMIWAVDGSPDTFRIKIWWEANGVAIVVYDNLFDTPLSGGAVVIH